MSIQDQLLKPKSLEIVATDRRLVGTDSEGNVWTIRWCGNGAHSHWVLTPHTSDNPKGDLNTSSCGWYVFDYSDDREKELREQIRTAEERYRIYA